MEKYNKFDTSWEPLRISSKDSFYKRFFIKGKFHSNVPNKIIEEYETIEYLMFYSYNHIGLYNEAFNKCMRLFEIAIKLKAKNLQISHKLNNGREKNLNSLINEICSNQNFASLERELNWFRKLRNIEMHPGEGSYLGAYLNYTSKLKLFVNMVNFLFLDEQKLHVITNAQVNMKNIIESFDSDYFTVIIDGEKYLIKRIINHKVVHYKNDTALILILEPVLANTFDCLSEYVYKPIRVIIINYKVEHNRITGLDTDGNPFELNTYYKKEHMIITDAIDNGIKKRDDRNRINYKMYLDHKALLDIIDLTYIHTYD